MLKKQKGITLIALIITIIVMLILVGVTINVALNGGLFEKAEQAAIGTEKQAIYEQIVSNMELTNEGKISVKGTFDKVIAEFGADKVTNINPAIVEENTTEVAFSIVGKTGAYNYKISTASVEKDPVNETKQEKGLVYGKIYKGPCLIEGETVEMTLSFSKKYGVMFLGNCFDDPREFIYDEQNKTITMQRELVFNISDDGKVISDETLNINAQLTDEESFTTYNVEYLSEIDAYSGIYYNKSVHECIAIHKDTDGHIKYSINGGTSNAFGISIIDSKHIERNGNTYTLIETME